MDRVDRLGRQARLDHKGVRIGHDLHDDGARSDHRARRDHRNVDNKPVLRRAQGATLQDIPIGADLRLDRGKGTAGLGLVGWPPRAVVVTNSLESSCSRSYVRDP